MRIALLVCVTVHVLGAVAKLPAEESIDYPSLLKREIIGPHLAEQEAQDYCDRHVSPIPAYESVEQWQAWADMIRSMVLDRVVYRGEAAQWRDAPCVEWFDTIAGGPGYKIKKLRYEALPGLWIPALLYEPEKIAGRMPVSLAVNGHDGRGKAADYKQMRCINQAKRGMLVLNVEWLGMGQLRSENFRHSRMNQLDLCGTAAWLHSIWP